MIKKTTAELGIWAFIGIVLLFSNNVIDFLRNVGFKLEAPTGTLVIIVLAVLMAYYHEHIAREIAGATRGG